MEPSETLSLPLIHNETRGLATLALFDEHPAFPGKLVLVFTYNELQIEAVDETYFHCLCEVRRQVEPMRIRLLCFGASRDVYPSGMSLDMGVGDRAYKLRLGSPGRLEDHVWIFDSDESVVPATLQEQKQYFEDWLGSLKAR